MSPVEHPAVRAACRDLVRRLGRDRRLPNTLNVSFPGCDGEELLARTQSLAAATGSACHSGRTEPSAVLTAIGLDAAAAALGAAAVDPVAA